VESFVASPDAKYTAAQAVAAPGLELLGASLDVNAVHYMRDYPYFFRLRLYYRVDQPQTARRWMHLAFFEDKSGRIVQSFHDLVTRDLLAPAMWPVGRTLADDHVFIVPYGAPGELWHLRVAFTDTQLFDDRYPGLYEWTDIGTFTNERSVMNPLAPL
jgi:hypothetical protein